MPRFTDDELRTIRALCSEHGELFVDGRIIESIGRRIDQHLQVSFNSTSRDRSARLEALVTAAREIGWSGRDLDILAFARFGVASFYASTAAQICKLSEIVTAARVSMAEVDAVLFPVPTQESRMHDGIPLPTDTMIPYLSARLP